MSKNNDKKEEEKKRTIYTSSGALQSASQNHTAPTNKHVQSSVH